MGASLSSRLDWSLSTPTSTHQSATDSTSSVRLVKSIANQDILYECIRYITHLVQHYPDESKVEFRRPLQYTSTVRPIGLQNSPNLQGFHWVNEKQKTSTPTLTSTTTRADGQPILILQQMGDRLYVAKISNFEYIHKMLLLADDNKLNELSEMLQSNRDPLASIFGLSQSNPETLVTDIFDTLDKISSSPNDRNTQRLYRLATVLTSFDLQLSATTIKSLQKIKLITIDNISEELALLQEFAGSQDRAPLRSIDWESDNVFSKGYRAPPWRQVHGELAYIDVECVDKEKIVVTASKKGYFINKGHVTDDRGTERLNYEKTGDEHTTLIELLSNYSPHFASHIHDQEYLFQNDTKDELAAPKHLSKQFNDETNENSLNDETNFSVRKATEKNTTTTSNMAGGNAIGNTNEASHSKRNQQTSNNTTGTTKSRNSPTKRQMEPSAKWKALEGVHDETRNENQNFINSHKIKRKGTGHKTSERARRQSAAGTAGAAARRARIAQLHDDEVSESESDISIGDDSLEQQHLDGDLPSEYWQIQKLVKYLRIGNQTATIIAICSLRDFDLRNDMNQFAVKDVGGLEILINLLEADDPRCKVGALQILKEVTQNSQIRSAVADLDGMQPLIELLKDNGNQIECLAAETIAHCAKNSRNCHAVRRYGGIRRLVRLLKTTDENLARGAALALCSSSKSSKNKAAIQAAGSIPLLANLLASQNEKLLIPVVGILQECASDENYRIAIRTAGLIKFLVENLSSKNVELQTHCASAIFKCAEDDETRKFVKEHNGLAPLVGLVENSTNKDLLVAATGAIWKCAKSVDNVSTFIQLQTIKKLVLLMEGQPEEVVVNVVGALGACAKTPQGRQAIRESNGIVPLVNLLKGTDQAVLINSTAAVGAAANEPESMFVIDQHDGVRLLWSLLKSSNAKVQASAAWAICPCIEHAKDAGEMVRSFVGGLELIVSLLKSEHIPVLASVCAAIANIAKDEENLAVITDHGVVPMLAKLSSTKDDTLRKSLSEAIARCCHWGANRAAFGDAGAVAPLVKYLRSADPQVHPSTAKALHQLSMDANNCITMHEHGVVHLLLGMVGSSNEILQEAAAGTIANIRRLALAGEKGSLSKA